MNTQQAWSQVPLPWFEATDFNPALEPGEEGIRIWVPSHVNLRATDGRIPLFGTVQLRVETLESLGIFDRHPVRAVVVGGIVHGIFEPYVGNALLQAPLFPPREAPRFGSSFLSIWRNLLDGDQGRAPCSPSPRSVPSWRLPRGLNY